MISQTTQLSSQPGQMTANEVPAQTYPVFQPVMYMPQMQQDESFMFQNQQFLQNTMTFPVTSTTSVTNPSPSFGSQVPSQSAGAPSITSETSGTEVEGEKSRSQSQVSAAGAPFQLQYSQVQPAQYVAPFVFPQVPLTQQQLQQYVPCVVPGAPFQPTFQPMVFLPQQQPATTTINQPELHPTMRSDSSHSRHESYDGSEYSGFNSNSLRRFSSEHSKDGYGSDHWDNRSRHGKEQYEDEEQKEGEKTVYEGSRNGARTRSQQNYSSSNSRYHSKERGSNNYRGRERSRSDSQKRPTSRERQEEMYKTELCSAWVNSKKCRFGHRCIFAHGVHELRSSNRKKSRQQMRPVLKKYVTGLLNKITDKNFDEIATEYLTIFVEEIRENRNNLNTDGKSALKALINKANAEKEARSRYMGVLRKLFKSHPNAHRLKELTSSILFSEYDGQKTRSVALANINLIHSLVDQELIDDTLVHRILDQVKEGNFKDLKVELWCKLITNLGHRIDASVYMHELSKCKTLSSRIRFMIMDLEELLKRNRA